jgi:hypothetical protein
MRGAKRRAKRSSSGEFRLHDPIRSVSDVLRLSFHRNSNASASRRRRNWLPCFSPWLDYDSHAAPAVIDARLGLGLGRRRWRAANDRERRRRRRPPVEPLGAYRDRVDAESKHRIGRVEERRRRQACDDLSVDPNLDSDDVGHADDLGFDREPGGHLIAMGRRDDRDSRSVGIEPERRGEALVAIDHRAATLALR